MTQYNNYSEIFPTLSAFSDALNTRKNNKFFTHFYGDNYPSYTSSERFTGTKDYKTADQLLICGDSANLDKLMSVSGVDLSAVRGNQKRNVCQKSVCGGVPLVPVFLTGVPKNMLASRKITTKTKVISLLINCAYDFHITTDKIINLGAKLVSIIRYLEKNGIRVNLYAGVYLQDSLKNDYQFAVLIKNAGAPLNLLNIAYPIINPSFLRRHVFRWLETLPISIAITNNKRFADTYGNIKILEKTSDICKKIGKNITPLTCHYLINSTIDDIANNIIKDITI